MDEINFTYELEQFGKRLKQLRKGFRLSQLDLEVKTGISRADISKIENGLKNIEFFTIIRLAYAIGVPVVAMFNTPLVATK